MEPSQFCLHQAGYDLAQSNPALLAMPNSGVNGQFLQKISGAQTSEESMQNVVLVLPVELGMAISVDVTQGNQEGFRGEPVFHRLLR